MSSIVLLRVRSKISHEKSRIIFSTNVNHHEVENISATINIPVTDDLRKYLGVRTLSKRVTKSTFQYIVDWVDKRLTGWRTKCLSLPGPVTLIKSTLTAIPTYAMQTCWVPKTVCDELDRKVRPFLRAVSYTHLTLPTKRIV